MQGITLLAGDTSGFEFCNASKIQIKEELFEFGHEYHPRRPIHFCEAKVFSSFQGFD